MNNTIHATLQPVSQSISKASTGYTQVLSQRIHYLTIGSGFPVILLHGMGGSVEDWSANFEALSQHYRLYALDIPGFGMSPPPALKGAINLNYMADLLHAFVKAEQLERVFLMGQSLGGGIATEFAINYPERLAGLVLIDSASLGREVNWAVRLQSIKSIHRLLQRFISRKTVKQVWESMFYNPAFATDDIVERTWQWMQKPETKNFLIEAHASAANLCGQRVVFLAELAKIEVPTIIIWGENDSVFSLSHAYAAHQRIRNSTLKIFSECGHVPQIEKADEFNQLVTEFFNINKVESLPCIQQ